MGSPQENYTRTWKGVFEPEMLMRPLDVNSTGRRVSVEWNQIIWNQRVDIRPRSFSLRIAAVALETTTRLVVGHFSIA